MIIAQSCEFTLKHLIVHFKWVNFMVCELYLNKTVKKKQNQKLVGEVS